MGLSGSGQETHRAVVTTGIGAGGVAEDLEQLPANEDREIVGVNLTCTATDDVLGEISFSSSSSLFPTDAANDNAKASTIAHWGRDLFVEFDFPIEWSAGEEIHLHGKNNSGGTEDLHVVIHYREL